MGCKMVVKGQRALLTPFRDATTMEAVPLQLVLTLFTGKHDMTWERHIHIKKETTLSLIHI